MTFQTRLTVVYVALFLVVQGGVLVVFNSSVPPNVRGQIEDQLSASARVFERIIAERVEQLSAGAQLLSRDFGFRDAVATQDRPTIVSALQNQRRRIRADLALVMDLDENVIAAVSGDAVLAEAPQVPVYLKEQAETEGAAAKILEVNDRLYELVLVPVKAPVPIAWIVFGLELDEEAARDIKALSPIALDIAFFHRSPGEPFRLAAATSAPPALDGFLAHRAAENGGGIRGPHEEGDHLFFGLPLMHNADEDVQAAAVLYYSLDVALKPYTDLVAVLLGVIGAGLAVLVAGSVLVSRGVTRPLRGLAQASRRIAAGDYEEVAAPTRDIEINDLTRSFNAMISAVKEREEHIRFQASHDTETGLPNRLLFERHLSTRVAAGRPFVMMLVEVQQLAELRSVLNHLNVNDLMKAIGERLRQVADTEVARLSTESFAMLLGDGDHADKEADVVASIVRNCLLTPFEVGNVVIDASVKMGLVQFPRDGADTAALQRHANAALDQGRQLPQGMAWYDAESDSSHNRRLSLMSEFRQGLAGGEVAFAYQPKLDLASGDITAVEALVRWVSRTRGPVAPDEFIPLAERTGDVRLLTEWGLRTAVEQLAAWRAEGRRLAIAVNLSASDLMNQNLPSQILELLRRHQVPASRLKLEVTESAVMQDTARALEVLNMLAAMGVTLAIDDYGTGYSSLSYIKRLPVNEIKIDKSFVMNLAENEEDNILVRSTIELGHNLGLTVTAEGVEDGESLDRLRAYGCDAVQGFHIGRPVPVAELEQSLEKPDHVTI